eukprot:gene13648-3987_t
MALSAECLILAIKFELDFDANLPERSEREHGRDRKDDSISARDLHNMSDELEVERPYRQLFGCVMAICAGISYGVVFVPSQYMSDHHYKLSHQYEVIYSNNPHVRPGT